jgi:alpha-N-arabinofuranosidase
VIKTVNYSARTNTLLVRLQGKSLPRQARVKLYTITAPLNAMASFDHREIFTPVSRSMAYTKNFSVDIDPYSVAVMEIQAE